MRYHGASFRNTFCHQPPSIVTQSVRIYDQLSVSPIGQILLLILTEIQYPLKVESPCNIVTLWIITIDSLRSWFILGPVKCVSHALVHLPWQNHNDDQDKSTLQLEDSAL